MKFAFCLHVSGPVGGSQCAERIILNNWQVAVVQQHVHERAPYALIWSLKLPWNPNW